MREDSNGHWTVNTSQRFLLDKIEGLGELVETKFAASEKMDTASEKLVNLALENSKEAVKKAEDANNERFRTTNEWRGTVTDIVATLATKQELLQLATQLNQLVVRFERMESSVLQQKGDTHETREQRSASNQMTLVAAGILLTLVMSIVSLIINVSKPSSVTPQAVYSQPQQQR